MSDGNTRTFEKRGKKGKSIPGATARLRQPPFHHSSIITMSPSSSTNGVAIHRTAASMKSRTTNRRRVPPSIPYQIDLSTSKTGRHLSPTKRRVTFKFGLASLPHLGLGCSGPECRGLEHEVILFWSLASGKRRILLDGREVHFSCGPIGENSFSANFPLPGAGNHMMQLVADLTTGGSQARAHNPSMYGNYKHFDLRLDGQSFHDMLHIYELGGPKCRNMYGQAMAYAESLPRDHLEQSARNIGTARGEDGAIRHAVPDRIVEHYEDATYASAGEIESSGVPDFGTITPKDRAEEQFMYEFARQKSIRNGSSGARRQQHQQRYSRPLPSAPPQPSAREQIPSFGAVHGAFRSEPPQRPMRTIEESEDLIDLSSNHPSSSQHAASGQLPPGVQRTPSDITIDLPDTPISDDVSAMGDDASVVGGYGRGPTIPASMMRGESTRSFQYAPPPTWEDAVGAFGAGSNYGQASVAPSGMSQQQAPPPPSFAVPPPPSVAPPSTAPTDASFAARAQPNVPRSGASFAFAPAPTWDDVAAQFGSYIPQPQQHATGPWQGQQPHQPQYAAAPAQTSNPFSPTFAG